MCLPHLQKSHRQTKTGGPVCLLGFLMGQEWTAGHSVGGPKAASLEDLLHTTESGIDGAPSLILPNLYSLALPSQAQLG